MKFISLNNFPHINYKKAKDGKLAGNLIMSETSVRNAHSTSGILDRVIKDFHSAIIKRRSNHDLLVTDEYLLELIISRRSVFYATVLLFPCILLNLLSFVIFTLPLKDTGRENFAVTLILTYFVFLIMIVVDTSLSSGNDIPLLGLYIILSMGVVLVNFVVSLVLIEIHEHCRGKDRRMPSWLTKCLDSKCVLKCFTSKRHFQQDDDANDASDEIMETEARLMKSLSKKKAKRMVSRAKDEYKWKVFCMIINFIFFVLSFIAHLILALVMYLKLSV